MVGYLGMWGDLSDADLDAVDDLLRLTTSGGFWRGIVPPGGNSAV